MTENLLEQFKQQKLFDCRKKIQDLEDLENNYLKVLDLAIRAKEYGQASEICSRLSSNGFDLSILNAELKSIEDDIELDKRMELY